MTAKSLPHSIRAIEPSDQPILWEILYEALWDPPTGSRRPKSVLANPHIAAYVENWGAKQEDLGFLAVVADGTIAGGILSRLMVPPMQGGAFFDPHTPQLGIAVFPPFQNQGIGTSLFRKYLPAAAARFPRVSLGVHPQNQIAIHLYKSFGFRQFGTGNGGYLNLVADLDKW